MKLYQVFFKQKRSTLSSSSSTRLDTSSTTSLLCTGSLTDLARKTEKRFCYHVLSAIRKELHYVFFFEKNNQRQIRNLPYC
mmetsp:Transcript_60924/g.70047  ORF Transcript_60924/g.70047 Transcript_60924/m.70047 type:complete len:81 (+) Transcript_60924:28-270(+)